MSANTIPPRSGVQTKETWNAELVFPTRVAWQKELADVGELIPALSAFSGTLGESAERLTTWFDSYGATARRIDKLVFYAVMAASVDSGDAEAVAMVGQAQSLYAQFAAASAFAEPEILAMDESLLQSWLERSESLGVFRHHLHDVLRLKPHYRSGEVEEVLGMISDPFGSVQRTFEMLANNDMKISDATGADGAAYDVTQSNIEFIKKHVDREVRRSGMNNYADAYLALRHTFASNYITAAKQAHATAKIRGYGSVLELKLSPHNLPTTVFTNLIETFKSKLPVWHRYWEVKRRLLKLDAIRPYDIWAPLTPESPSFSYNEAVEIILSGMAPLGSEYTEAVRKGCLEDRWVDYAQNQGKAQGAFSYGTYDTHPCILTSFDGSLTEVSILAHELGHSMHSLRTWQNQPYVYSDYSSFVAEVASNFNQAMVRATLFRSNDNREFQLAVIQEAMDNIHRYFFIMPTLARFESAVYEKIDNGEPVNADVLQELMASLYAEGYGDALSDDAERTSITWATFPHLYMPFYTFQYATGISAAQALCSRVLGGSGAEVDDYLRFLSLGSAEYPLEALKVAGVDMTTSAPVEAGFDALESLIDRLETLID